MNVQDNKDIVARLFGSLEEGRVEEAMALVAEDAEWWVQGIGVTPLVTLREIWSRTFAGPGKREMKITTMTAEDDRVAAEIESDVALPDGRDYRNTFNNLFYIKDGQIVKVREYFDTAYIERMFGPLPKH